MAGGSRSPGGRRGHNWLAGAIIGGFVTETVETGAISLQSPYELFYPAVSLYPKASKHPRGFSTPRFLPPCGFPLPYGF